MQLNDIFFAGYAGRDAETKKLPSGSEQVTFSLCSTRKHKDGKEESTWVNVVVYGAWISTASRVKKGDNVMVSGQLRIQNYKDKQGVDRVSVSVLARTIASVAKEDQLPQGQAERTAPTKADAFYDDIPF